MRKFEKILFVYSIVAITAFFIVTGFTSPSPQNFVTGILLLPLIAYFWLRLTSPVGTTVSIWSKRFFVSLAFLSFLGTLFYYFFYNNLIPAVANNTKRDDKQNEVLLEEIQSLRMDLEKLKAEESKEAPMALGSQSESFSDILYEALDAKLIAIKATSRVMVYEKPDTSSKVIGQLAIGREYETIGKTPDWFVVKLGELEGWVNASEIREVR